MRLILDGARGISNYREATVNINGIVRNGIAPNGIVPNGIVPNAIDSALYPG
ncbi:hypothetical protein BDW62DRAFT_188989 [Aspergillus aurantiobrunneus]